MDNKYHNRLANDICDSAAYAALFDELQSVQTCSQSRSQSYVKSCSEATTPPDSGWVWWDTDSVVPNEPLQAPTFSSVDGMSKALRRKTQNRNAQRAHRERQRSRVNVLHSKIQTLEKQYNQLFLANKKLKAALYLANRELEMAYSLLSRSNLHSPVPQDKTVDDLLLACGTVQDQSTATQGGV